MTTNTQPTSADELLELEIPDHVQDQLVSIFVESTCNPGAVATFNEVLAQGGLIHEALFKAVISHMVADALNEALNQAADGTLVGLGDDDYDDDDEDGLGGRDDDLHTSYGNDDSFALKPAESTTAGDADEDKWFRSWN